MDTSQLMNVQEERQDDEKNMIVSKLVDLCLTLTEHVIRLKDLIEATTMERRMSAAMPAAPKYSYCTDLIDPFIRDIRQRQQQEQQQQEEEEEERRRRRKRIIDEDQDEEEEEEEDCEDMIDCDDSRRVMCMPPPFKRRRLM